MPVNLAAHTDEQELVLRSAAQHLLTPPGPTDPYPDYAVLRGNEPVYVSDLGFCLVSTYAECYEVVGGADYAVQDISWFDGTAPGWQDNPATLLLYEGVQCLNPPVHGRFRALLTDALSPRRVAEMRHHVEGIVDGYLDAMADAGSDGSQVDIIDAIAARVPVDVIGELMGIPTADRMHMRMVARRTYKVVDLFVTEEDRRDAAAAADEFRAYWAAVVAQRRKRPGDDLTSQMVAAADAGQWNDEELMALLLFVFGVGFATLGALLGNATVALLTHPEAAAALRADPGLAPAVVEESLRYEAPSQFAPRLVTRDTILGGVNLPTGQLMIALLGAGNRDPIRFTDPDRFDIFRTDIRPLSFGRGAHYCIGATLSRMEGAAVLPRLLRRFPKLTLADTPVPAPSLRLRQYANVPLTLTA